MSKYYYILNVQGDVIQLVDSENYVIANYTYDAWGKVLSVTDASGNAITDTLSIANVNPIRYRGYFYDSETGLYYCNSRYYDPAMRRFINADGYVSTGQGFGGYNMFAYCQNNPVMLVDPSGCIVSDWDRAHVGIYDLDLLQLYTDTWERDNLTAADRDYQHQMAVAIRKKYMSPGDVICSNGYVIPANNVKAIVTSNNGGLDFALYDNDRFVNNSPYHEQIFVITTGNASLELSDYMFSGSIEANIYIGGWEFDYIDLSLFDVGNVSAEATLSSSKIALGASASVWSPSISTSFWGIDLELGAEVLGVGAGFSFTKNGLKFNAALIGGLSFTLNW